MAAGGGGGGSTDYCCAHGGWGGNQYEAGNGTSPAADTPWPLSSGENPTPIARRYDFTSHDCPAGAKGAWCVSVWDLLPGSLPPYHQPLQYGSNPQANYTLWSTGGLGGRNTSGGPPGTSGSYLVRLSGTETSELKQGRIASMYSVNQGIHMEAVHGMFLIGGNGAGGKEGGGKL